MNPYDPCVWNKYIGGNQLTIMFQVDNLLMSHIQPHVVTLFIKKLEVEYGQQEHLTVTQGKVHEYLGITIDFLVSGRCAMSQYNCIKKLWLSLPDNWKGGYRNKPAGEYFFDISDNTCLIDDARKQDYHTITAKTLWVSQQSRPDIQLATGFHCTCVKSPTEHNWKKLRQLLQYLWKTRLLPLIIGINRNGNTTIYIYIYIYIRCSCCARQR